LDFHDVLFQLAPPDKVFTSFYRKTISRKRREDGVVCGKGLRSHMEDSQPGAGMRRHCSLCDTTSHMIDWDHVDGIIDIGDKSKLNASLCKAPDEVVRVGDWSVDQSVQQPADVAEHAPAVSASPTM
jgi:hypothetical protein